jgi:hypothetical protein
MNPDVPLDKESLAEMQRHVDRYYRMFVESVARNRATSTDRVESEFWPGADRWRAGRGATWDGGTGGDVERGGEGDQRKGFGAEPDGDATAQGVDDVPLKTQLTCRRGTSELNVGETCHAPPVRCSAWFGVGERGTAAHLYEAPQTSRMSRVKSACRFLF